MASDNINGAVSELQVDVAQISMLVNRIDVAISKLTEVSTNVSNLLSAQEQRITTHEKLIDRMDEEVRAAEKDISELREKTLSEMAEIRSDIDIRLGKLEKLIYIAIGGGSVIMFLINQAIPPLFGS